MPFSQQHNLLPKEISEAQNHKSSDDDIAAITIDTGGKILECNKTASRLLEYDFNKKSWPHISKFIPQLAEMTLLTGESINPKLRFLSRIGHHFDVIAMNGLRFASKLYFIDIDRFGEHNLRLIIVPTPQN